MKKRGRKPDRRVAFQAALAEAVGAAFDRMVAEAEAALDAAVSELLGRVRAAIDPPAKTKVSRKKTPEGYPPSRRAREDRDRPQANGKSAVTCTKCGFVGGNARGCGTAHPTMRVVAAEPPPVAPTKSVPRDRALKEIREAQIAARSKQRSAKQEDDGEDEADAGGFD